MRSVTVPQSQLRHWTQGTLSGLEITLIRQACLQVNRDSDRTDVLN